MKDKNRSIRALVALTMSILLGIAVIPAAADEVTDWNAIMFQTALVAPATSPLVMNRNAAIVQASVFDALNGIERRYTSIHVQPAAPRSASRRAAVVQAAYAALLHLYQSQKSTLDLRREASLDAIASDEAAENSESIARGVEWGQTVADEIWAWRLTDGITPPPPPFLGGSDPGEWRPTPPAFLPGAGPQFAYMTPWVMLSPSQFRPAGPPALDSVRYAADLTETQSMGSLSSTARSADQTLAARFWNSSTAAFYWHRIALNLGAERHLTLSKNSRLLALVSLAMGDAVIACWEAKYHYVFWRPITAIRITDSAWTPLLVTPAFPEYPSGHSTVSGAAAAVLADYFGENSAFSVDSDVMLGVVRSFTSFSAARAEVEDARIFGGIHFRSACDDADVTGTAVGNYVVEHALLPLNGNKNGKIQD
jgi:membrane-associated phospholipid phosphatase